MTKIKLFFAVIITSFALVFVPVKQEAQACDVVCLLQMGGQTVQDVGAWIKGILGSVWQTVSKWLSDAAAWIDKYMQKAWGGLSKGLSQIGLKDFKAPNLRDKSTGIEANKSYNLAIVARKSGSGNKTVSGEIGAAGTAPVMTNVAETKGAIEQRAAAKENELLSVDGTLVGRTLEEQQKAYIAQQEAIDGMAKALVAKNTLADLERLAKELDELMVTIQQGAADAPETSGNQTQSTSGIIPATGHNMATAIKNNISVRLLWDELLTTQQQIMAMRLKANTVQAISDMEDVSSVVEIEEPGDATSSAEGSSVPLPPSSLDTLNQGEGSSVPLPPSSLDTANKDVGYYTGGPFDANNPAEPKE